jgi:hypothetical protein
VSRGDRYPLLGGAMPWDVQRVFHEPARLAVEAFVMSHGNIDAAAPGEVHRRFTRLVWTRRVTRFSAFCERRRL